MPHAPHASRRREDTKATRTHKDYPTSGRFGSGGKSKACNSWSSDALI